MRGGSQPFSLEKSSTQDFGVAEPRVLQHAATRSCKVSLFVTRACPGPPDTSMAPSKRLYWSHTHIRAYMHRPDGHSTRQVRPVQLNGPLGALSGMHGPDTFLQRVPHTDLARQPAAHPHARAEEEMPKESLIVAVLEELGAQSLPRGRQPSAQETACSERACECGRARARAYPPASEACNGIQGWSGLAPRRGRRGARAK